MYIMRPCGNIQLKSGLAWVEAGRGGGNLEEDIGLGHQRVVDFLLTGRDVERGHSDTGRRIRRRTRKKNTGWSSQGR